MIFGQKLMRGAMRVLGSLMLLLACFSLTGCAAKSDIKDITTKTEKDLGITTGNINVSPISVSDKGDLGFNIAKQFKGIETTERKECWDVSYKSLTIEYIKIHPDAGTNPIAMIGGWFFMALDVGLVLPSAIIQQVTFLAPKPGCKFISTNEKDIIINRDLIGAKAIVTTPPGERYELNDDGSGSFTFRVEDIFRVLSAGKSDDVKLTVDIEHENERYSTEKLLQKKLFDPYLISLLESDKHRGKAIKYLSSKTALTAKSLKAILGHNGKVPEELTETLKMFVAGEEVNAKDTSGDTPLIRSAKANNSKAVELLLEYGANSDDQNSYGDTSLILASKEGYSDVVMVLLKYKANPSLQNTMGKTALSYAISENRADVLKILLEYGKTHKESNFGLNELMHAVNQGKVDVVKMLLDNGVDTSTADAVAMIDFAKRVKEDREAQLQLEIAHRNALAQQQAMAQQRASQNNYTSTDFFLTILSGAAKGYAQSKTNRAYTPAPTLNFQSATLKPYTPVKTYSNPQLAPNNTYVGGTPQLAPDGTYVGGKPQLAPDGTYVGGTPQLAPDGTYVSGRPQLAPDGTYVSGRPQLAPDGTYVGGTP
jgi:ankyrin repeat protein